MKKILLILLASTTFAIAQNKKANEESINIILNNWHKAAAMQILKSILMC